METQQQYDPLLTPLVVRHRMSMPTTTAEAAQHFGNNNNQQTAARLSSAEPTLVSGGQNSMTRPNNNNNSLGGVISINNNNNTVRWSCQSYESGITESSFSSSSYDDGQQPRVNVQEMLDRGFEETEVLRRWLDSFGLLCYFDCFLLAGYDSLAIMSRMSAEDLTAIGITEPNHRRRLKHELGKLHFADNYADLVNDNLFEFLTQLGLEHYTGALSRTGCDTTARLLQLELDDLEDVGVAKLGHQKKLYLAIKHYCKASARRLSRISVATSHYDSSASRPPHHHHHRLSATTLMRTHQQQQQSPTNNNNMDATKLPKLRPPSVMTKQQQHLSTFQEAPRSPTVIVSQNSAAATAQIAANIMRTSPYGFTTTAQQQQNEIYSTGSIGSITNNNNNNSGGMSVFRPHSSTPEPHLHRTSFNYSPLRFPIRNNNGSPSSRTGSVHSGPAATAGSFSDIANQRQQQNFCVTQPTSGHHNHSPSSPSHSLGRLSFHSGSQQQQHVVQVHAPPPPSVQHYSTPPPPGMAQYMTNNNYAIANGHATLPRTSSANHSHKKSPQSPRVCDPTGEQQPASCVEEQPVPCPAATTTTTAAQIRPRFINNNSNAQSGVPPPPPPRARATTLDYSNNNSCSLGVGGVEFPPPPSPLQVPMTAQQQIYSDYNNNVAPPPPATIILSRKQPACHNNINNNIDISSNNDFSYNSAAAATGTVRGLSRQSPGHHHYSFYGRAPALHELFAAPAPSSSPAASNAVNKPQQTGCSSSTHNNNISSPDECMLPSGIASSMSTTDSGNSSASSVDEEHDARAAAAHMPSSSSSVLQQQQQKLALLSACVHGGAESAAARSDMRSSSSSTHPQADSQREPEDVLNEISGMLASLTDELDYMLKN